MIEELPIIKTDFFLKLPSEASMPEALAAFYEVDTQTVIDDETGEAQNGVEPTKPVRIFL